MILDPDDRERFYRLHKSLIFFVNQRLEIVESPTESSKKIVSLPDQRLKVRDALLENTSLIDEFVEENPFDFAPEELDVVRSWKHFVAGEFYVLRFLFDKGRSGELRFGHVRGDVDYRAVERDGKPAVEFSWDGNDDMDPAQGRGWAIRDGDEIEGRIFFHQGDESAFRAVRKGNDA